MLFEAIFFGFLLYMLSQKDVSIVWPLTALGFIITSLAARIFLKEEISSVRWAGICLIVLGAGLVTWSAKAEGERARRTIAGFNRLHRAWACYLSSNSEIFSRWARSPWR